MNKKIEKVYLIHVVVFGLIYILLKSCFGFDIFAETYKSFEESKAAVLEEINLMTENMRANPDVYNATNEQLAEYQISNTELMEQAFYYCEYYIPAMYLLLILGIVLIEFSIYKNHKMNKMLEDLRSKNMIRETQIQRMIVSKINFAYRRIYLPKHIPIMFVIIYIIEKLTPTANEVLYRSLANMLFALAIIITVFGVRVVIKFFKTKNDFIRVLITITNVIVVLMVPQFYFIVGFLESMLAFRIIIKTDKMQ
ncbi:MAG: hypothetical protein MJ246_01455 [Clostridia bacterium]|nr:hypothetical protein [Clostridia bacterium]